MPKILEKKERRLGEKLFLKGDRCTGAKCAMVRRAYAPGVHGPKKGGKGRGARSASEFGALQREKQKLRFFYGLDDGEVKRYVSHAAGHPGLFETEFIRLIERRLDIVVRRLGLAPSGRAARQAVNHGHITVNGRMVRTPSYAVRTGDTIGIKESSSRAPGFTGLSERLAGVQVPGWLTLDAARRTGIVNGMPDYDRLSSVFDAIKVKEFYSR